MKQPISWFNHIEHEDTKLTKSVLHFSNFSTIFYVFFKYCCTVFIGSSDKGVGSSDKGCSVYPN